MENIMSLIELMKKVYELTDDDMKFMVEYFQCTRKSFEKELENRTRHKKGKKDILSALESLGRFESVMSYLLAIKPCVMESLISQAEELNSSIEITKLYSLTEQVHKQVGDLLQQQAEATKVFNSKWNSMRSLTAKQRRDEKIYTLWKSGLSVIEIKNEIDKDMEHDGEAKRISRQTIYKLISEFKKQNEV